MGHSSNRSTRYGILNPHGDSDLIPKMIQVDPIF